MAKPVKIKHIKKYRGLLTREEQVRLRSQARQQAKQKLAKKYKKEYERNYKMIFRRLRRELIPPASF